MKRTRSAVAIVAGIVIPTILYVALGKALGGILLSGVELGPDEDFTKAGMVRYGLNISLIYTAFFALSGFIAAVLAPARRWRHGLAVGVTVLSILMLVWLDSVRSGMFPLALPTEPIEQVVDVALLASILAGSAAGGLAGQWLMNRLRRHDRNDVPEGNEATTA